MAQPTREELDNLSLACQGLWRLDVNRCEPGRDYQINLQGAHRFGDQQDTAADNLFTYVSSQVFQRPTYGLFYKLLDKYHRDMGTAEHYTPEQEREMSDFLDAVIASSPMQYTHALLSQKNLAPGDKAGFKAMLHQMWFSLYRREVQNDSSGFEHVFVGEAERDGKVSGFHNWLQFYLEEQRNRVDYKGYILPRKGGAEDQGGQERLISVSFAWGRERKDVSSMFIGSSPEMELALYTLCFIAGTEENYVQVGNYEVKIRCYHIRSKYGDKVGSAFPELIAKLPGPAHQAPLQQAPVSYHGAAHIPGADYSQPMPGMHHPRPHPHQPGQAQGTGAPHTAAYPPTYNQPMPPQGPGGWSHPGPQQQGPYPQSGGYPAPSSGYGPQPGGYPQQEQQQEGKVNQGCSIGSLLTLAKMLFGEYKKNKGRM